jgi:hypothetical protein
MSRRHTILTVVVVGLLAVSCSGRSPAPARTGPSVPMHPSVTVTPSDGLRDGQRVMVQVTGFVSGKIYLSECATSTAANPAGCGPQLAAQPFLVTGDNGAGSGTFTVSDRASARPYSSTATSGCAGRCVIVATLGLGPIRRYAYIRIDFAG